MKVSNKKIPPSLQASLQNTRLKHMTSLQAIAIHEGSTAIQIPRSLNSIKYATRHIPVFRRPSLLSGEHKCCTTVSTMHEKQTNIFFTFLKSKGQDNNRSVASAIRKAAGQASLCQRLKETERKQINPYFLKKSV